jgi:hypothetical protein
MDQKGKQADPFRPETSERRRERELKEPTGKALAEWWKQADRKVPGILEDAIDLQGYRAGETA